MPDIFHFAYGEWRWRWSETADLSLKCSTADVGKFRPYESYLFDGKREHQSMEEIRAVLAMNWSRQRSPPNEGQLNEYLLELSK